MSDAINKHNERNPGKEIVYLNYAAVDPSLTNERCSFWHFRFDINADMKMEALTAYMAKHKDIKKVYLINQDYAFGHAVDEGRRGIPGAQAPRHPDRRQATSTRWRRCATSRPTSPRSRPQAPTPSSPATGAPTWRC